MPHHPSEEFAAVEGRWDVKDMVPVRVRRWATELEAAGHLTNQSPLILAAIMDRESLGGDALNPSGPSGTGDGGHGLGLMQIDRRYHRTFAAAQGPDGVELWSTPAWNVLMGAQILAYNLKRFGSNPAALPQAIASYNASERRVRASIEAAGNPTGDALVSAVDSVTTGGNYVSTVLTAARSWGWVG